MSRYIIAYGSEMTDVPLSFFKGLVMLREELVGDTYFLRFENGDSDMTISINQKEYDRVKTDLRELKINSVLEK